MVVSDLMTRQVHSVSPGTTIKDLLALWAQHGVSGFPVVEDGRVIGVVSEGDLIERDAPPRLPRYLTLLDAIIPVGNPALTREDLQKAVGATVREVMSAPAITIGPDQDVREAARIMRDRGFNRLPVVDAEGHLLGIIARHDVVAHLAG